MRRIRTLTILLIISALAQSTFAQENAKAYQLYDGKGKQIKFEKMVKRLSRADIIFFGELHDNPISHWLELKTTQALYESEPGKLVMGAEMFEADEQLVLNEYLKGFISTRNFEDQARLWKNYKTDYKPLVLFAKKHHIPFIATNVPRRYASMVYKKGLESLDSLPDASKKYIAPLPIEVDTTLSGYQAMLKMAMGHGGKNLPLSQALKDATMAHFILANYKEGERFIHYNGAYHSNDFQGIVWYIHQQNPNLKVMTINTVEQKDIGKLNEKSVKKADFTLCVPSDMIKTMAGGR